MKTTLRATEMLRKDHDKVRELFERFENSDNSGDRADIMAEIVKEVRIHSTLEEEIFYPMVKKKLHKEDLIKHSIEEHHKVDDLLQEIEVSDPEDDSYEELFETLSENISHHLEEEESQMLPEVEKSSNIDFEALGKEMDRRRKELRREYS